MYIIISIQCQVQSCDKTDRILHTVIFCNYVCSACSDMMCLSLWQAYHLGNGRELEEVMWLHRVTAVVVVHESKSLAVIRLHSNTTCVREVLLDTTLPTWTLRYPCTETVAAWTVASMNLEQFHSQCHHRQHLHPSDYHLQNVLELR